MFKLVLGGAFIIGVVVFTLVKYLKVGMHEGTKAISQGFSDAYKEVFEQEDSEK